MKSLRRVGLHGFSAGVLLTLLLLSSTLSAAVKVALSVSPKSPQPEGTPITFTATASDKNAGVITYRYSLALGQQFVGIVRDFSQNNVLNWTPATVDGTYTIRVVARNNRTGSTANAAVLFTVTSRVTGNSPVLTRTSNPLVALFSAPACPTGSSMRVQFGRVGTTRFDTTSLAPCQPLSSMNFYVAGMRGSSTYVMRSEVIKNGKSTLGKAVRFSTGKPVGTFPPIQVLVQQTGQDSATDRVLLLDNIAPYQPFAVDLQGNVIWSSTAKNVNLMTRVQGGGKFYIIADGTNSANTTTSQQLLQEVDLVGNVLRETNATRVAEQIVAKTGLKSNCTTSSQQGAQCISGWFSHEVRELPNGHILALADIERVYTDGTQGSSPSNPIDVLGDIVVDLDQNLQVAWFWNSFAHMDVNRAALLNELCTGSGSCGPVFLQPVANDWLHSNSIYYVPSDGSLIISMRHQDWVVKIDYQNGKGTGDLIWRLGLDGDFHMNSSDNYPWFSHQHDAQFVGSGTSLLTVFDDGNTRVGLNPSENSRGQALKVNQNTMQVSLAVNADLGVYSSALGSAQILSNGNYHFLPGLINPPDSTTQNIEVMPNGKIGYNLQNGGSTYRSFRIPDLYTPPTQYVP